LNIMKMPALRPLLMGKITSCQLQAEAGVK
jgi:hypothetical protein